MDTGSDRSEINALARSLTHAHGAQGWLNAEDIITAANAGDLELLRAYVKLLPEDGCNTARVNVVVSFFRRNGVQAVPQIITKENLASLLAIGFAVSDVTGLSMENLDSPVHDQIMLESLNHPDKTDEIVSLVRDRNITDADSLKIMLSQLTECHPAVNNGIL